MLFEDVERHKGRSKNMLKEDIGLLHVGEVMGTAMFMSMLRKFPRPTSSEAVPSLSPPSSGSEHVSVMTIATHREH